MRPLLALPALFALTGCYHVTATALDGYATARFGAAGLERGAATVGDQHIVYFRRPGRETLVLLHGYTGDANNWLFLVPHLPRELGVVALDLPGHGESTCDEDARYDTGRQAERVVRLLDKLRLGRVHLAGNSMGGHIAALIAARFPERVRTLALLDAAGVTAPETTPAGRAFHDEQNPYRVDTPDGFERYLDLVMEKRPDIPGFALTHYAERAVRRRAWRDKVLADLRAEPAALEALLPHIRAPTLVVWGAQDRVIHRSAADVFAAAIPRAERLVLDDTGHVPHMERPEETAAALARLALGDAR